MQTLSFGFKKPQTGDRGSVFYPALEDNIQQLNDHTHNGVNSARLTAASSEVVLGNIAAGGWVSLGGGNYRQLVTLPASLTALTIDKVMVGIKGDPDGHVYYLTIEKASSTTFWVYTNDNTKSYKAIYTT